MRADRFFGSREPSVRRLQKRGGGGPGLAASAFGKSIDPTDDGYANYTLDLSHTATAGGVDALDLLDRMGRNLNHLHLADGHGAATDEHLIPRRRWTTVCRGVPPDRGERLRRCRGAGGQHRQRPDQARARCTPGPFARFLRGSISNGSCTPPRAPAGATTDAGDRRVAVFAGVGVGTTKAGDHDQQDHRGADPDRGGPRWSRRHHAACAHRRDLHHRTKVHGGTLQMVVAKAARTALTALTPPSDDPKVADASAAMIPVAIASDYLTAPRTPRTSISRSPCANAAGP